MAAITPRSQWVKRAKCGNTPSDLFLTNNKEQARRLCSGCPVLLSCRVYGLVHFWEVGVYGGLTQRHRNSLTMEREIFTEIYAAAGLVESRSFHQESPKHLAELLRGNTSPIVNDFPDEDSISDQYPEAS